MFNTKMGLLKLAEKLGNLTEACKVMGYSRDSSYRFQKLYEDGGELVLKEIGRTADTSLYKFYSEIYSRKVIVLQPNSKESKILLCVFA